MRRALALAALWYLIFPVELAYAGGQTDPELIGVVDLLDTPVLVTGTVNIPSSNGSVLEVVHSLAGDSRGFYLTNTSTSSINLYVGASGSESQILVIPPSVPMEFMWQSLKVGSRLSVRSSSTSTVTSGSVIMQFFR